MQLSSQTDGTLRQTDRRTFRESDRLSVGMSIYIQKDIETAIDEASIKNVVNAKKRIQLSVTECVCVLVFG